jgi:predicted phage replisome organizer
MADVKWIKLSVNMFEDEKIRLIEALPEADTILIIWVKLLAQAGKTNASGYIYLNENIPFTDEMLATIFNRPIGTVRLALKTFQQFGMLEISEEHFISISNWEKHQNLDGLDKIREQNKLRKQKERAQKKLNSPSHVTVTPSHATEEEVEEEREEEKDSTTTTENPVVLFEKVLCRLSEMQMQKLYTWLDDFNGQADILNEAITIADNKNKRYYNFVEFLLKEWSNNKLDSLDRVRAYEQEKFNKLKPAAPRTGKYKNPIRKEMLPDWFEDPDKLINQPIASNEDSKKLKEEIAEKLKKIRGDGL